jgi:hypothetical protein|tara:strand:+ start:2395 stop:2589 length:195 start_codon:yes stop_codon:yes gene_type:complete
MSEQIQTRAERELETWKMWAVNMRLLQDIHKEIDEKNSTLKEEEEDPVPYSANSKYQHQYSVSL